MIDNHMIAVVYCLHGNHVVVLVNVKINIER